MTDLAWAMPLTGLDLTGPGQHIESPAPLAAARSWRRLTGCVMIGVVTIEKSPEGVCDNTILHAVGAKCKSDV